MIGRINERMILSEALESKESELIAIYGRRRVGKTYLIREHYANDIVFAMSGLFEATLPEQLFEFQASLVNYGFKNRKSVQPTDWFEAFGLLKQHIEKLGSKKKVIFFDEFPWMCNKRSRFLTAFESFWNGWASARKDLVVVICGSASSWMLRNIEKSKGGLYNRVTSRIVLAPFTLHETELFFKEKKISLSRKHISDLYMMLGGIPHYLKQVRKSETPNMAVERLIFKDGGLLANEFEHLFNSLFGEGGLHKTIVEILCKHRYGMQRDMLLSKLNIQSSGWFTNIIEDLVSSGFLQVQQQFGKKSKEAVIKVVDNYCLFYVNFKKSNKYIAKNFTSNSSAWKTWSGLTFENICFFHQKQILLALGINGISTAVYQWQHKGDETMSGAQVDMLIHRSDGSIHLCEIKFNENPFIVTKKYAIEMRSKISSFSYFSTNRDTTFVTFICAGGVVNNTEYASLVDSNITLDDLFKE
jgi:uncharacterized protein